MARIIKNTFLNFFVFFVIFTLLMSWFFNFPPDLFKNNGFRIWQSPQIPPEIQEAKAAGTVRGFITSTASTTWRVPLDWTASNTIEVIGGGGGGRNSANGAGGGGGGAYAKISNLYLTLDSTVYLQVGTGGGKGVAGTATWFNDSTATSTTCGDQSICAQFGAGASSATGAAGGASSTSVGDIRYKGGNGGTAGGSTGDSGGGGGGAAGPNGNGGNGGTSTNTADQGGGGGGGCGGGAAGGNASSANGADGGDSCGVACGGSAGDGGNGGVSATGTAGVTGGGGGGGADGYAGGDGSTGQEWDSTHGSGGGGGGWGDGNPATGNDNGSGGLYGGGGGGGTGTTAVGKQGIIVITYTKANITVGSTGTQNTPMNSPSTNQHVGGAFTFINTGGTSVSQIKITETDATFSADTYLSNVKLYYKEEAGCSASIPGDATVFNATGVGFSSEVATVVGDSPMSVGTTTQVCVYVQLNVSSGAGGLSFDIAISNPSTDVTVSAGTITPATAVAISGSTLLQAAVATVSCSSNVTDTSFSAWASGDTSIKTSSPDASTTMSCSGTAGGCTLYIKDAGNGSPGLYKSSAPTHLIASADATLQAGVEGYGIQATSTKAGLTIAPKYLKTGDTVGGLMTSNQTLASSGADISNAETIVTHKAAVSESTLAGSYSDTITYECTAN